jgi:NAD dependent epimerase/dehydratase family enzyme
MRAALVLSPERGGIFDTLLALVRRGLGGTAGDGRQYISWLHEQDFIRAVNFLISRDDISGAVNLAAPNPLPNAEFMRILREAWGMPIGLPAAKWMLKLGALLMQSETELILKSRRVVPTRLLEAGFKFDFPDWKEAARDLCQKWRKLK